MNVKQKLGYMFIGCLFTIAGYILASLGGALHAQQDEPVIDKIVCRELQVVNKEGKPVARIGGLFGNMTLYNAAGKRVAVIGTTENGDGIIAVRNAAGKGVADITVIEDGGAISVRNTSGKGVAHITATENGNGTIRTYNGVWRTH